MSSLELSWALKITQFIGGKEDYENVMIEKRYV